MYKLLLAWRYLRTRYIALASIISVTLGVATMIVVNAVMEGFTRDMENRIHGMLSDVTLESHGLEGFPNPEWHLREMNRVAGEQIESMTPVVQVPALLSYPFRDGWIKRQVQIIGIDPRTQSRTSDFGRYLLHPENRREMSFSLRDGGFDLTPPGENMVSSRREQLTRAGWTYRRWRAAREAQLRELERLRAAVEAPNSSENSNETAVGKANDRTDAQLSVAEGERRPDDALSETRDAEPGGENAAQTTDIARATDESAPRAAETVSAVPPVADPFASAPVEDVYDPATEQSTGVVLGIGLGSFRDAKGDDRFLILPGDDVKLSFPNAAVPPRPVDANFTVVDFYECRMSEYDGTLVFVPLDRLQELCGLIDPRTGVRFVSSIQIKVKPNADLNQVRDRLRGVFPAELYGVYTWRDKQSVLLAATQMETAILNVLLFLIIAVAGFGILAIFFMIVVEKTRDIGVLKSLGAPSRGVMGIFLGYGLSLGAVGAGAGLLLGLWFVAEINRIAEWVGYFTGHEVFDPSIYYFQEIPTIIEPLTVGWIVAGALAIAILASVLPARRAARLHPVEALRYE